MAKGKVKKAKKAKPPASPNLVWQIVLGAGVAFCLLCAVLVWMSGSSESVNAFTNGRRLLVRLDTGVIQGKPVTMEEAPAAAPIVMADPVPESKTEESFNPPPPSVNASPDVALQPSGKPIAEANPALLEKTESGAWPVVGADGTKPWRYYAKSYDRKGTLPMIAIVVSGLGENKNVTEAALTLPENIAFSFSPYAKNLTSWVKAARIAGHEMLIDLPLEPANYPVSDPGPYGLLAAKGSDANQKHLQWLMSRFPGYVGFLTPQNEVFTANADAFKELLQTLTTHGLMLAVGSEPAKKETKQMIESGTAAAVIGDVLLDEELSATAIQDRLGSLERTAKSRGYAIGIAQAYPITVQQLKLWSARLAEEGFVLVPVTFIAHLRYS
jgi:polysaccharide deacetylase 2 family uncharacterized protein YibQ